MQTGLAMPTKGTSWPDLVLQMEVGETKPFPYEKRTSIRPAISGRVKLTDPKREYEAKKGLHEGKLALMVKRLK